MKILFLTLGLVLCSTAEAQTLDSTLLKAYDAATLRSLYQITRSTPTTAEQQVALAQSIQLENSRFAELLVRDGGILTPASEAELAALHDRSLRRILSDEQLLHYFRRQVDAQARERGKAVQKIVAKQLKLSYMELKYIDNTFFKIEQETLAARLFYKNTPAKAAAEIKRIYEEQLAQLEKKSGIRVDKDLKATRITTLTDYAPVTDSSRAN